MASQNNHSPLRGKELLAQTLRWQLRLWRGGVGARLNPERALAEAYGLNTMMVRRALKLLEIEGILVRKHGSGTYLRKLPDRAIVVSPEMKALGGHLREKDVFCPVDEDYTGRLQPPADAVRLKFGFLGNTGSNNENYLSIKSGVVERVRQTGHKLELLSTTELLDDALGEERWVKDFRTKRCDGLIAELKWAESLARVSNQLKLPMVYVWPGTADTNLQPLVNIDLLDALPRALRLFAEQGLKRIAFIDVDVDVAHPIDIEVGVPIDAYEKAYARSVADLGLDYQAYTKCRLDHGAVLKSLSGIFAANEKPEAIYVGDDILMRIVAPVLEELGYQPGKDVALITVANRGNPLPPGCDWSRMEFDCFALGQSAVDSLLREIETAGDSLVSFSHRAAWRPGETHEMSSSEADSTGQRRPSSVSVG